MSARHEFELFAHNNSWHTYILAPSRFGKKTELFSFWVSGFSSKTTFGFAPGPFLSVPVACFFFAALESY